MIRISSQGRIAVAVMVDVALHRMHWPISLRVLSQRHRISLSLLEQIVSNLRRHDLVEATRGPGGGYWLGRPADAISVADIVFAVDGRADGSPDEGAGAPPDAVEPAPARPEQCVPTEMWETFRSKMVDFLQSSSLHNLTTGKSTWGFEGGGDVADARRRRAPAARPSPASIAPNSVFDLARFNARERPGRSARKR